MAGGAIVLSGAGGAAAAAAAAYLTYGGTAAALLGTVAKQTAQRLTQNKYHPYTGCFRSYSCDCPFPFVDTFSSNMTTRCYKKKYFSS